ncbi:hypothetical protein JCM30471_06690 [Desulfuromonas carbonis]|uniref:hypothetical protein n=1 Tax=Desulfuromonas sp. DDH964 TaxID=1823759 RepID=UPI00078B6CDF|nr:hypothetical protein [Desulfuromonas sp. DDH964]AMV72169.1 hypothetical protein DBW_1813 [Desulfuromonas sp. DDH964]
MKSYLVLGLFSLHVVVVSLVRYLRDEEFFRLTAMKRAWGRSRGLAMHFLANIALPMVLGIVFISQAVVSDRSNPHHPLEVSPSLTERVVSSHAGDRPWSTVSVAARSGDDLYPLLVLSP